VYDQNKQRMPTETLVEKQYIGKELAEKLPSGGAAATAKDQPPQQRAEQTPKQEVKKKQTRKQEKEKPVKKQRQKQKLQ
jgi:hypothetical protein